MTFYNENLNPEQKIEAKDYGAIIDKVFPVDKKRMTRAYLIGLFLICLTVNSCSDKQKKSGIQLDRIEVHYFVNDIIGCRMPKIYLYTTWEDSLFKKLHKLGMPQKTGLCDYYAGLSPIFMINDNKRDDFVLPRRFQFDPENATQVTLISNFPLMGTNLYGVNRRYLKFLESGAIVAIIGSEAIQLKPSSEFEIEYFLDDKRVEPKDSIAFTKAVIPIPADTDVN